jgi:predicted deacylase
MTDLATLAFRATEYTSPEPGPRLIVTGAVHGNETCGAEGIRRVLRELDAGELRIARGTLTLVPVANPLAYARRERNGDRNLNRNFTPSAQPRDFEDRIVNWLAPLLQRHEALLDLHSTRAATQPFATFGPPDNDGPLEPFRHSAKERAFARCLGVTRFVEGWLSTYARGVERRARAGYGTPLNSDARYGVGTTEYMRSVGGYAVTLECGQHDDPNSVDVAHRAIHNALAFLGMSGAPAPAPVERYELIVLREVVDRLHAGDKFAREWSSFDRLRAGDVIGHRHDGTPVAADRDGWIVFPDHKAQPGNEWFYFADSPQPA